MTRQDSIDRLRRQPSVSVLVIGGGINGIGTFVDLALQGVDVLLVERADFCSGASAASSHMLHGGIRYLENGEFRLVKEALHERNRLIKNAPHCAKPLPTTIPIFRRFSGILNAPLKFLSLLDRPAERGALVIKIGLLLYDWYTRDDRIMPTHRVLGRAESLRQFPALNPEILYTATYYDGFMPTPERLCIELILDTEAAHPQAQALNYVSVGGANRDSVILRDELSGEEFPVKPAVVVNAAGPWIDLANRAMGAPTHFVGGTKGSHLVLDHPELRAAIGSHEFFFENQDGRIVLILPFLDKVIVGTSDIPIDDPDDARCTDAEIEYFLGMIRRVFPRIQVDRSQIVFTFSGVRPLPPVEAATTGQISRDHSLEVTEPDGAIRFPIYSLVGGKWTTFRAFAEQTADAVLKRLGRQRQESTRDLPIGGGHDYPISEADQETWLADLQTRSGLPRQRVLTLFERYGTRAQVIADYLTQGADAPLVHLPDTSVREIQFLAQHEKVVHLTDLVLRRTLIAMLGQLNADLVAELAETAGQALGWPAEQRQNEIRHTLAVLQDLHRIDLRAGQSALAL